VPTVYKHYNNNQTILTFPIEFKINPNHIVVSISDFVDSIPTEILYPDADKFGRPKYSPAMMMKLLLFAYMRHTFSGRAIQEMAEENLPMKWLIGNPDEVPSYRSINRFRISQVAKGIIKKMFLQFHEQLSAYGLVDDESLFIDGTKIVADANKYSFVWRKSVERNDAKLEEKASALFDDMIQEKVNLATDAEGTLAKLDHAERELEHDIDDLDQKISAEKVIKGGSPSKQRRRKLKHFKHIITSDLKPRKQKYEDYLEILGNRNSFSKTDHDATFMRMKEDPMQNGQLKPGYNLQIGTQNQFVLFYDLNQRPADQRTLVPFLNQVQQRKATFRYVVADAGYGSEPNYDFVLKDFKATPLIPYTMYLKEQSKKYKNDANKVMNWAYDNATDSFTDQHHIQFSFKQVYNRTDKYGFQRTIRKYEANQYEDPEGYHYSITERGNQRSIQINPHWEMEKRLIRVKLSSKTGASIYAKRKIEVEPVFGNLKANLAFKRLSVRGLEKAKNELGIILMAGNLKKMMKIILSSRQQSQKSSWKNLVNKFFQLLFYSEVSFVPATFLFGYHAVEAVGSELPFMSGS